MKINIEIERHLRVPAEYARVQPLLQNIEQTIGRFPKLRNLKKLGEDEYLWEMETIGSRMAKIAHEVSYAARYHVDAENGRLSWTPLPGYGNATIQGAFKLQAMGDETELRFQVSGELRDVPVPLMYRLMAPPFIQGKFTHLVETFLDRTGEALVNGKVGRKVGGKVNGAKTASRGKKKAAAS